jgi:hypothetical protein
MFTSRVLLFILSSNFEKLTVIIISSHDHKKLSEKFTWMIKNKNPITLEEKTSQIKFLIK